MGTPEDAGPGQLDALVALYCADRDKVASLANERLALLAVQMTYLGLAIIALGGTWPIGGAWVAAFSAAPLWFMNAHHQVLVAAGLTRSYSVTLLEHRLYEHAGLDPAHRHRIGHYAGVIVRDLGTQPRSFRVQSALAFTGVGAALVIFTGYALAVAAEGPGWVSAPVLLAAVCYAAFATASVIGWRRTARMPGGAVRGPRMRSRRGTSHQSPRQPAQR